LSIRARLRRTVRTTVVAVVIVLTLAVASTVAIAVSRDPAPLVISFGALAVSALQFWRAGFRGPDIAVFVVDSPAIEIVTPSDYGGDQYSLFVRQPVVMENVGGQPCAVGTFRIPNDIIRVSGWFEEHMVIEDQLGGPWDRPRPIVLVPREPKLFTIAWSLRISQTPADGKPLNLRERFERTQLGEPTRHAQLTYSESGGAVDRFVRLSISQVAIRDAVEQLVTVSEGGELSAPIRSPDSIHLDFGDVPNRPAGNRQMSSAGWRRAATPQSGVVGRRRDRPSGRGPGSPGG
jgi:hypothetical protein